MQNTYAAEAQALLAEAAQELPEDATAAAAIKATMAQAYASLALAQEVAAASEAKTAAPKTF
ncbi:hypothetical protein PY310_20935 [Pseudarthrobacter sp. H3Y2-7]|uniref:hypothetical protein n=1 Tax=Pseudarthrobacter naphthalenicus TaxID=3031328 RepID=UPI0023B05F93|nr:hypothetical protein [Pseudarthrobacter sp. H3Y2-7]MDE8671026.1 hypothetical protein [Pseudarthrobacter sp. H3Y2-7]